MNKYYIHLWLRWLLRVSFCSVILASLVSFVITVFSFFMHSDIFALNAEIFVALGEIFWFWLLIAWSGTLLLALFRSIKYIFNVCIVGYELKLLSCDTKEPIAVIGYGDLVKVWRKWFMLLIWLVASMMTLALGFTYLVSDYTSLFAWFNIFWLFLFVLIAGYFSFILMIAKCKRVELRKC